MRVPGATICNKLILIFLANSRRRRVQNERITNVDS